MSETTTEVECPRCGKSGKIQIPEEKIGDRAFAKCPECGLIYDDSYFNNAMIIQDVREVPDEVAFEEIGDLRSEKPSISVAEIAEKTCLDFDQIERIVKKRGRSMTQLKDVLCLIGIHDWSEYAVKDVHFPHWVRRYRACRRCDTKQAWLGGHGGSEIGCWTPVKSRTSL